MRFVPPRLLADIPVLRTIGAAYHIDPVHMGLILVLNTQIGQVTPAAGRCMYVVRSVARVGIVEFTRESIPFVIALLVVLAIAAYLPHVVLFPPHAFVGGR